MRISDWSSDVCASDLHRREGPVKALRRCFGRRNSCRLFNRLKVPAGRLAQRNGEYGAVAVNDVIAKDQRDFEPRALDSHALQLARIFGGIGVEDGADPAGGDIIMLAVAHRRDGRYPSAGEEVAVA